MSVLSISLGSSLASVGISVANPSQLAAIRDTVNTTSGTQAGSDNKDATAKSADKQAQAAVEPEFSPSELRRIAELERIDTEVKAHEQAHINAGRGLITSAPSYAYTYGPDGKQYAISGEVGIDTSPEQEAQANIDKGQRIQDTALAPADPSPQDYQVAATGKQLEQQGRSDLSAEQLAAAEAARDNRLQAYASTPEASAQVDVYA